MSRLFYHVMQDNSGNLLFDVSGTMRLAGSGTLATIYGDEALTVILPNPMTNHPSYGSFKCYLGASAAGYDFYMAKSGYTFETLTGVQGHGTMAQQNANAVAITGGTATGLTEVRSETIDTGRLAIDWAGVPGFGVYINDAPAGAKIGLVGLVSAGSDRYNIQCTGTAPSCFTGTLVTGPLTAAPTGVAQHVWYAKAASQWGMSFRPSDSDAAGGNPLLFLNAANGTIGSVSTNGTTTTYNTTSDARLKHAVQALAGALDVVRALRPITGRWIADDSPLVGFLAHEVAEVVDGVVTGERDAVDDEGRIVPQMIDYSKLVPWLVSALQALAARVVSLEHQLGV